MVDEFYSGLTKVDAIRKLALFEVNNSKGCQKRMSEVRGKAKAGARGRRSEVRGKAKAGAVAGKARGRKSGVRETIVGLTCVAALIRRTYIRGRAHTQVRPYRKSCNVCLGILPKE